MKPVSWKPQNVLQMKQSENTFKVLGGTHNLLATLSSGQKKQQHLNTFWHDRDNIDLFDMLVNIAACSHLKPAPCGHFRNYNFLVVLRSSQILKTEPFRIGMKKNSFFLKLEAWKH